MRALILCLLSTSALAESGAGIRWTAPRGWETVAPSPGELAHYRLAGVADLVVRDSDDMRQVRERWTSSMRGPEPEMRPERFNSFMVVIDHRMGTWENRPDHELLGAIVYSATKKYLVFELVGPKQTFARPRQALRELLFAMKTAD
jgi:hypothetical protein